MKNAITQALIAQSNEAICFAKRRQTTAMQLMAEEVLKTCSNIADHCGLIDVNQLINRAQLAIEKGEYLTLTMPGETTQVTELEKRMLVTIDKNEQQHLHGLASDLSYLKSDAQNGYLMLVSQNESGQTNPRLEHMPTVTQAIIDFCNEGQRHISTQLKALSQEKTDIFGNPEQSMGVICPGCKADITTINAGGYRNYCEHCVAAFPAFPNNQSMNGYQLTGTYPNFEWVESREWLPENKKTVGE
jgi:hypothetical protein